MAESLRVLSESHALTADVVAEWRAELRAFFAESALELKTLIEALESPVEAAPTAVEPDALPDVQRSEPRTARSVPSHSERRDREPSAQPEGSDNSQQRLAELARRLEETIAGRKSETVAPGR
jgi:hypothetical protein